LFSGVRSDETDWVAGGCPERPGEHSQPCTPAEVCSLEQRTSTEPEVQQHSLLTTGCSLQQLSAGDGLLGTEQQDAVPEAPHPPGWQAHTANDCAGTIAEISTTRAVKQATAVRDR
jgi:hypothetical protein